MCDKAAPHCSGLRTPTACRSRPSEPRRPARETGDLSPGDQRQQVPRIVNQDVMARAILQTIPDSLVASPTSSVRQPPRYGWGFAAPHSNERPPT